MLPQTEISKDQWSICCGSWGPRPLLYPAVKAPMQYSEVQWSRDRIVEVAKKYVGLPYLHRHIPDMGGLDCSNFSSWVYNYGLGIGVISNVEQQAQLAGRKLSFEETLEPGDLVFIYSQDKSRIAHVVIYLNQFEIIDSTNTGVEVRKFTGWYKDRFAWARRVIE
jgi:cell wall-associated NlpC family hydrolase